jgi:uncharacterized LabA/DUF88 family protein
MIFIDGSNVFHGRNHYNAVNKTNLKIDYSKLVAQLAAGRNLVRSMYFCSKPIPPINPTQLKFHQYLRNCGIQVIEKELKTRPDPKTGGTRSVEKGVDVALAVELLGLAWEGAYDVAIVVSGDGDYVGAIQRVMGKGKNVEIAAFKGSCSAELKNAGLKTTFIDDIAKVII